MTCKVTKCLCVNSWNNVDRCLADALQYRYLYYRCFIFVAYHYIYSSEVMVRAKTLSHKNLLSCFTECQTSWIDISLTLKSSTHSIASDLRQTEQPTIISIGSCWVCIYKRCLHHSEMIFMRYFFWKSTSLETKDWSQEQVQYLWNLILAPACLPLELYIIEPRYGISNHKRSQIV